MGASTWDVLLKRLREGLQGEFRVTRELGRGGQAAVYLAEELVLRRQVAIKVLARNSYIDEATVARFQAEARTIAGFRHQHIVTVYSIRSLGGLPLFIMQYLEGRSLAAVLREDGPLPWALARAVLYQVGTALQYAHSRNVVHRDIKPANIIFDGEGNAVVTDFGIAKRVQDATAPTTTGMLLGTPAYMSPEQCHGESVTPASDQYGLGIVAYELISGRVPFTGSELVIMHGHSEGEVPSLRNVVPDCPPHLEAAVMRMLAKRPSDRFPTLHAALDALGAMMLRDDDPVRHVLQDLAMHTGKNRGRSLTPTFGFAATSGLRYAVRAPQKLVAGERAVCRVVLVDAASDPKEGEANTSAREVPVTLPVAWSASPAAAAGIDATTGEITGRQAGLVSVRAVVAGQALTVWVHVIVPAPATGARQAPPPNEQPPNDEAPLAADNRPVTTPRNVLSTPSNARHTTHRASIGAAGLVGLASIVVLLWTRGCEAPPDVVGGETASAKPDTGTRQPGPIPVGSIGNLRNALLAGQFQQPTVTWRGDLSAQPDPATLRWSSDDPQVLRIDSLTGALAAVGRGSTIVRVRVGAQLVDARTITVTQVKQINLTLHTLMSVGDARPLNVQPTDLQGDVVTGLPIVYRVSPADESIVRVDSTGMLHAVGPGTATVTVIVDGVETTFQVEVQLPL